MSEKLSKYKARLEDEVARDEVSSDASVEQIQEIYESAVLFATESTVETIDGVRIIGKPDAVDEAKQRVDYLPSQTFLITLPDGRRTVFLGNLGIDPVIGDALQDVITNASVPMQVFDDIEENFPEFDYQRGLRFIDYRDAIAVKDSSVQQEIEAFREMFQDEMTHKRYAKQYSAQYVLERLTETAASMPDILETKKTVRQSIENVIDSIEDFPSHSKPHIDFISLQIAQSIHNMKQRLDITTETKIAFEKGDFIAQVD